MSMEENALWLKQTISSIFKERYVATGHDNHLYINVQLPKCVANYGFEPGTDALLSMNILSGCFRFVKDYCNCCIWLWVSIENEVIDTATIYIRDNGESEILSDNGDITISCIRQYPGAIEGFLMEFMLIEADDERFIVPDNDHRNHLNEKCCHWHNIWTDSVFRNSCAVSSDGKMFFLPRAKRTSGSTDLRNKGFVLVPEGWYNSYLKKKRKDRNELSLDVAKTLATGPVGIVFALIGFLYMFAGGVPGILAAVCMWGAVYIAFVLWGLLYNCFDTDTDPICPEELKELLYLHSLGFGMPMSPPKNEPHTYGKIRYYGFMDELNKWELSDYDKICLAYRKISPELARRLGMGANESWDRCYYKITGKKIIGGAPYPYERRT